MILDDFGLSPFTALQAEDIYELIAERHLKSSIIITSNRPPQDWVALFPDPVLANSALDRLSHNAHHIMIDSGESYRKKLSPGRLHNRFRGGLNNNINAQYEGWIRAMEILAWNSDKQRLATMDVEFTKENTTWFEKYTRESDIQRITDVDGGILIGKAGYGLPCLDRRQIESRY